MHLRTFWTTLVIYFVLKMGQIVPKNWLYQLFVLLAIFSGYIYSVVYWLSIHIFVVDFQCLIYIFTSKWEKMNLKSYLSIQQRIFAPIIFARIIFYDYSYKHVFYLKAVVCFNAFKFSTIFYRCKHILKKNLNYQLLFLISHKLFFFVWCMNAILTLQKLQKKPSIHVFTNYKLFNCFKFSIFISNVKWI